MEISSMLGCAVRLDISGEFAVFVSSMGCAHKWKLTLFGDGIL